MNRRPARSSAVALLFSLVPWPGFVLAVLVGGLVPPEYRAIGVAVGTFGWLGSTLLASFGLVTSGFAVFVAQARRESTRGRAVALLALASSVAATLVGVTPPILAVLGTILALIAAVVLVVAAVAMIPAMGPMGRPLGPVATGAHLLFAPSERIWAARAEDEARSVHAFDALCPVLEAHDAPAGLIERVRRAAADEARHAVLAARLAGCPTPTPARIEPLSDVDPGSITARLDLARESFVDGCIGEAFAAAVLSEESRRTGEPMGAAIAADEAEHAVLAWDLLAWCLSDPAVAARFEVPVAPHTMWTPSRGVGPWTQLRLYRRVRRQALSRAGGALSRTDRR